MIIVSVSPISMLCSQVGINKLKCAIYHIWIQIARSFNGKIFFFFWSESIATVYFFCCIELINKQMFSKFHTVNKAK